MNTRDRGVTSSLNKLGIPVTTGQWVGGVIAVLGGIIIARILPFLYPIIFGHLLDFIFVGRMASLRDGFNSFVMTTCTCGLSFIISFLAFFLFRAKRKGGN